MDYDVLDAQRQKLLPKFSFLRSTGFYLAGGTALALQIGHRTSMDFDFYHQSSFSPEKIIQQLKENRLIIIQQSEDTLIIRLDDVEVSFFQYDYKLLKPLIKADALNMASLEDIAAMKIIALTQRGMYRDFIDLYFLIEMFRIDEIMKFTKEKYPMFNQYLALQALTYFDDAEEDSKSFKAKFFNNVNWKDVKKFFTFEAKSFKERELG